MESRHLVFVYGTLRSGHSNHHLLKDAYSYGTGVTVEKFAMYLVSGYPYVTSTEPRYQITGELYDIYDSTLEKLDQIEGHPRHHVRKITSILVNGEKYGAWMYFRDPPGTLMQSGDYNDTRFCKA